MLQRGGATLAPATAIETTRKDETVRVQQERGRTAQIILFADIVGSTALYEAIGDERAHARITAGMDCMKQVALARHGCVAAELGDEVMCFFDDPTDGAAAACEMHARFRAEFPADGAVPAMKLRIGMHYAETGGSADDLATGPGKIAHWAARNAKPEQTLATGPVIEALPRLFRATSRYVDDETLEFVSVEHLALHEIIWDIDAITVASDTAGLPGEHRLTEVRFSAGEQVVVVNAERPSISAGRGAQNDLVLEQELVSRQHFTVQFSRGRCMLTDRSTNGTFVTPDGGQRMELRHDSLVLVGSGTIDLGSAQRQGDYATLRYTCA